MNVFDPTHTYLRSTTCYGIGKTKTFRRNSKAWFGKWPTEFGQNIQNVEKSIRKFYWADEGKSLGQVDQSGADAFCVAILSGPGKYRELFLNKVKPHVYLALPFYDQWEKVAPYIHDLRKLPIPQLKTHPQWKEFDALVQASDNNPPATRYYYHYKQTCHSANYGIQADTFRFNVLLKSGGKVNFNKPQAERYLSEYRTTFPEIERVFQAYVRAELKERKCLRTLQGFPLPICNGLTYVPERDLQEWYAKIPQATVGIITAEAITEFQDYVEDNHLHWDFLQDGHDAMLIQAPDSEILEATKVAKRCMERNLLSPWSETFQMRAGCAIGKNWGPRKKDNPLGLEEISL